MKSGGWWVRYFCNGWNIFHHLWNTAGKIKVLLIVDEPSSLKNVNVLSFAKENDFVMLCLPHINFNSWLCYFMDNWKHITVRRLRSGWTQVLEEVLNNTRSVNFFALHMGKQQQLQMLQMVGRRLAIGQLMQMHLKTVRFCRATNKPIPNLNVFQHSSLRPCKDFPYFPWSLSEADKSKETDVHFPSLITQNERKCVPVQMISPVALVSWDVQRRKMELNRGSVVLTSSPYVKKLKEIASRKNERKRTRAEKVWKTSVQKVTVMLRRQSSKESTWGQRRQPLFVL